MIFGLSTFGQDAPEKSPFLPEDYTPKNKPTGPPKPSPVARYELRSIMVLGGVHTFSLFDTTNSKGFWIDLNETVEGVTISDYQKSDESESVLVRSGGYERRLKLKEAQIVALKVTPPRPQTSSTALARRKPPSGPPNTIPGPPPSGTPSRAAINNLSDQEVRARMQKVAEEIRRRRAMRRTMADEAARNPKK